MLSWVESTSTISGFSGPRIPSSSSCSVDALAGTEITAPMPGVVLAVHARSGERVKRGDLVCVVEAMKMQLRVETPGDGTVTKVLCAQGDQVKRGQRLAEFEAA